MQQLDDGSHFYMLVALITAGAGSQQADQGAQALAATLHDVLAHFIDQGYPGFQALFYKGINGGEVFSHHRDNALEIHVLQATQRLG